MPNLPCRNKDLAIALKTWIKSSIKLSMKDRIHFPNLFISLKVICERLLDPPLISKLTKKLFITYHMTLKFSIRSSFSKKRSKDSFLGKLLMDYISSISPSTSNIIVRLLMLWTVAQVQVETQQYVLVESGPPYIYILYSLVHFIS